MSLTLEQIQSYPMGENGLIWRDKIEECKMIGIVGSIIIFEYDNVERSIDYSYDLNYTGGIKTLPCLRSLDQLTNEITVEGYNDGKPFVPLEEIEDIFPNLGLEKECNSIIEDSRWINQCTHLLITALYRWHFAINIPKELYIEKI